MRTLVHYSIDAICDEARYLVETGRVGRQEPIANLCCYFPAREWEEIVCELERNDYLLRDRVIDLLGCEIWIEDS
jgi:Domain of unknown function (DUF4327)